MHSNTLDIEVQQKKGRSILSLCMSACFSLTKGGQWQRKKPSSTLQPLQLRWENVLEQKYIFLEHISFQILRRMDRFLSIHVLFNLKDGRIF